MERCNYCLKRVHVIVVDRQLVQCVECGHQWAEREPGERKRPNERPFENVQEMSEYCAPQSKLVDMFHRSISTRKSTASLVKFIKRERIREKNCINQWPDSIPRRRISGRIEAAETALLIHKL